MRILFLCTHNACRSILAEVIARRLSAGRIEVRSAGSHPAGQIHPLTLAFLEDEGLIPVKALPGQQGDKASWFYSKSIDEVATFEPHAVITLCDAAAAESCPVWLDQTARAHWGLPDPSKVTGTSQEINAAFREVCRMIELRLTRLLGLSLTELRGEALSAQLKMIGELT